LPDTALVQAPSEPTEHCPAHKGTTAKDVSNLSAFIGHALIGGVQVPPRYGVTKFAREAGSTMILYESPAMAKFAPPTIYAKQYTAPL